MTEAIGENRPGWLVLGPDGSTVHQSDSPIAAEMNAEGNPDASNRSGASEPDS